MPEILHALALPFEYIYNIPSNTAQKVLLAPLVAVKLKLDKLFDVVLVVATADLDVITSLISIC